MGFSFLMCVLVHTHPCAWSVEGVCRCAGHVFTDCVLLFFRFLLVKETQRVVAHKNNTKICRKTGVQGQWGGQEWEGS